MSIMQQPQSRRTATSTSQPNEEQPVVIIVDDDAAVREALHELILSAGMQPACFASTRDLLDAGLPERPSCLVLDVRMPGSSGLDFQTHLATKGDAPPVIFITGHGDIPMSVQAMKLGAVDFLTKPVRDQTLLDAVNAAIEKDIARRKEVLFVKKHIEQLATLTARERQVFREVARGRLNKQIAFDLGITVVTVKLHRGSVMRKMQAASIGELIRAWESLPADMRQA